MGYRQENVTLNINVLCSDVYNQLSTNGELISTDIYAVNDIQDLYIGQQRIANVFDIGDLETKTDDLSATDMIPIFSNGGTYRITLAKLKEYLQQS